MAQKIVLHLEQDEYSALLDMAIEDLRNPNDELHHILRMEIEKRIADRQAIEEKEGVIADMNKK